VVYIAIITYEALHNDFKDTKIGIEKEDRDKLTKVQFVNK